MKTVRQDRAKSRKQHKRCQAESQRCAPMLQHHNRNNRREGTATKSSLYSKEKQLHHEEIILIVCSRIHLCFLKPLPALQDVLVHLFWVFKRLGYTLLLHASLSPCNDLGALCRYVEVSTFLIGIKPAVERNERHIHIPKLLSAVIRLVSELFFQQLQALDKFLFCSLQFFSFRSPYLLSNLEYLKLRFIAQYIVKRTKQHLEQKTLQSPVPMHTYVPSCQ